MTNVSCGMRWEIRLYTPIVGLLSMSAIRARSNLIVLVVKFQWQRMWAPWSWRPWCRWCGWAAPIGIFEFWGGHRTACWRQRGDCNANVGSLQSMCSGLGERIEAMMPWRQFVQFSVMDLTSWRKKAFQQGPHLNWGVWSASIINLGGVFP